MPNYVANSVTLQHFADRLHDSGLEQARALFFRILSSRIRVSLDNNEKICAMSLRFITYFYN